MKKKTDFSKLDQIRTPEEWMESLFTNVQNEEKGKKQYTGKGRAGFLRGSYVAVAIFCVCILGTGISVAAYHTDFFQSFLKQVFGNQKVEQVHLAEREKEKREMEKNRTPDIAVADGSNLLSLNEAIEVFGKKEVFVGEVRYEEEETITDQLYSLEENGLFKVDKENIASFQGSTGEYSFSFDYIISDLDHAVYAFNEKGDISTVFHRLDGDTIYVALFKEAEDSIVQKESIFSVQLNTGEVKKISGDDMICNYLESPNGKNLLCNHRSKGYWTVFDFQTGAERKIEAIDGYNRGKDIEFLDDNHILSLSDPLLEKKEGYTEETAGRIVLIDLQSGKVEKSYVVPESCVIGELGMQWGYEKKENDLEIRNIVSGEAFLIPGAAKSGHGLARTDDYALFGSYEEPSAFYFISLKKGTYKELKLPEDMNSTLEIYMSGSGKKSLITNGEKAYLVDLGDL